MKLLLALFVFMFSATVWADLITCTLASGTLSQSASLDLKNPDVVSATLKNSVQDLNLEMAAFEDEDGYDFSVVLISKLADDQIARFDSKFARRRRSKILVSKKIDNAADKLKYSVQCKYTR